MSIGFSAHCLQCHLNRSLTTAREHGTEEQATAFAKELMEMYLSAPNNYSAPYFSEKTARLFQKYYHLEFDRFRVEKESSNAFVKSILARVKNTVMMASDPIYSAMQFSVLGNYIDYSALEREVSMDALSTMISDADRIQLSSDVYTCLKNDLADSKNLLILTDNAGEIGFDCLLAEQIHACYPSLRITFCVRGGPALNDATREDAAFFEIPFPVIDNGTLISGTALEFLSPEASNAFHNADVILSKGQGNAETLLGCGYNVYYLFLVKCIRFQSLFQKEKLTPMLIRDKDWKN